MDGPARGRREESQAYLLKIGALYEDQLGDPDFADMLEANKQGIEIAKMLLGFASTEVQAAAAAIS